MREPPTAFRALGPGTHTCLPYASPAERHRAVAEFLATGLQRGERGLVSSTPDALDGVASELHAQGIDVAGALRRGALALVDRDLFYLDGGRFDVAEALERVRRAAHEARAAGFVGLRGAGGPPRHEASAEETRLGLAYEARVNRVLAETGAIGLCIYDRGEAPPALLDGMLRTHPLVVVGKTCCHNVFYDPAEMDNASTSRGRERRVDWMLEQLARHEHDRSLLREMNDALIREAASLAGARDEGRLREDRFARALLGRDALLRAVATQIGEPTLRLRQIIEELGHEPEGRQVRDQLDEMHDEIARIERALARLSALGHLAEDAVALRPEPLDLVAEVRAGLDEAARVHPELRADLLAPSRLEGRWDRARLRQVVTSLIAAAIEHGWGTPFHVLVEDLGARGRLVVAYPGLETGFGDALSNVATSATAAAHDRLRVDTALARELVRLMGGTLGVSVWPDGRVSITVDLPRPLPSGRTPPPTLA
jgi:hypothetical protein